MSYEKKHPLAATLREALDTPRRSFDRVYKDDTQAAKAGIMITSLCTGKMHVYRSARADWRQRYPNTPIVLLHNKQTVQGTRNPGGPIEGATFNNIKPDDLDGVDISRLAFLSPQGAEDQIALIQKHGATIQTEQAASRSTSGRMLVVDASGHRRMSSVEVIARALTPQQESERANRYLNYLEFEPSMFKANVGDWRDMHPTPAILNLAQLGGSRPRIDFRQFKESDFDRVTFRNDDGFPGTSFHDAIMPSVEFAQMLKGKGANIISFTVNGKHFESQPKTAVMDEASETPRAADAAISSPATTVQSDKDGRAHAARLEAAKLNAFKARGRK